MRRALLILPLLVLGLAAWAVVSGADTRIAMWAASWQREFQNGLAGALVEQRGWSDYSLGRDTVARHLGALDEVYTGVVTDHREALREIEEIDPISHDMLVEQTGQLELFQWFVRAHVENADGTLPSADERGEQASAVAADQG